ncbi:MAG: hypothetical protein P8J85_14805 [Alphaproteobacteria bacterium]|nr:hypothetical protein [Alphaproteobacteria bacterium]MDG1888478.1 hypothetical protein [Alphaproteobacteria bacterium]
MTTQKPEFSNKGHWRNSHIDLCSEAYNYRFCIDYKNMNTVLGSLSFGSSEQLLSIPIPLSKPFGDFYD